MTKIPAQNPSPPKDCYLVYPLTMRDMTRPRRKPPKFPMAKSIPTADPSPTGNTSSQPNSNIIGTKGIKKNELIAEMRLAKNKFSTSING